MIEFVSVSKTYPGITALDNINLEIKEGEFLFLVGPSGSGKTTIIKLLIKEEIPSEGNIYFYDTDITQIAGNKVSQLRQEIGVVFQDFKLLPHKNLYENIAFALEVSGKKREDIEETVTYVLDLVDLSNRASAFPSEISGGEKQKIAIARALSNNPKVLIADEPTGNLDPESSWEIIDLLTKINNWGTTVIMATHGSDIVNTLGKRVVELDAGRIISDYKQGRYPGQKRSQEKTETQKDTKKDAKAKPTISENKKKEEELEEKEFEITFSTGIKTPKQKKKKKKKKPLKRKTVRSMRKGKDVVDLHDLDIPANLQEKLIKAGYTSTKILQGTPLSELKKVDHLTKKDLTRIKKALEKISKK